VIWANHNVRASIEAIQRTTNTIYKEQSLESIEPNVSHFQNKTDYINFFYKKRFYKIWNWNFTYNDFLCIPFSL